MDFTYPFYIEYTGGLYRKPNTDEKVKTSLSKNLSFNYIIVKLQHLRNDMTLDQTTESK